ncbi:MAG: DegT/DnrJ/EryC1/StrS family aminotransferase [Phycisphaerales bacterium]|nr:DegT/DnrJ/EryC1/StrS family aminotransferase [Phycisphaerales bacterium]
MAEQPINLSGPDITDAEIEGVAAVLRTPSLSLGPKVPEFESRFTERLGLKHAIACNSGTSGLHLIWRALDVVDGAEVVTTPFSFIASSNSIMFTGAKPVFVDIDPDTWQIDAHLIEGAVTTKTRAVLPVDVFGSVPDMDAINAIAKKRKLRVVEDSCEALGTKLQGAPAGTLGEVGVFGFYPNKQITTGEGGMIVTNDDEVAFRCRSLRNQGRDPDAGWLQHARLGYNYRLCDINSALGVVQMSRLDEIVARRAQVARWYLDRLSAEGRITSQKLPAGLEMSWFVFVVRLSDNYTQSDRDRILENLRERGIGCSNYFTPIHLQPFYQRDLGYGPGDFPVTEALSCRTVALPFHNGMSEADVDRVVKEFRALL